MLNNVRKHNVRKPGKPPEGGGHLTILYPYIYIYTHRFMFTCMYIYIYIYVCVCFYACICIYIYICICIHIYRHSEWGYICMCIYIYTYVYARARVCVCVCVCVCACVCVCVSVYIYTYTPSHPPNKSFARLASSSIYQTQSCSPYKAFSKLAWICVSGSLILGPEFPHISIVINPFQTPDPDVSWLSNFGPIFAARLGRRAACSRFTHSKTRPQGFRVEGFNLDSNVFVAASSFNCRTGFKVSLKPQGLAKFVPQYYSWGMQPLSP